MKSCLIAALMLITQLSFAQSLGKQRIWKISGEKRSIYLDQGIFHSTRDTGAQSLVAVRNSYSPDRGYERVVFDFSGSQAPRLYGHISSNKKKVYIDFFNVTISKNISSVKKVKYVKSLDFFNIDANLLSTELNLSANTNFDVFYLDNPARVVIDIKK